MPGIIDLCLEYSEDSENFQEFTLIASKGGVTTIALDTESIKKAEDT